MGKGAGPPEELVWRGSRGADGGEGPELDVLRTEGWEMALRVGDL